MKKALCVLLVLCLCLSNTICFAENLWECPKCEVQNAGNFCGYCGTAKPEWSCPSCEQSNTTKFCTQCGMSKFLADGILAVKNEEYDVALEIFSTTDCGNYAEWVVRACYGKGQALVAEKNFEEALEFLEEARNVFFEEYLGDSNIKVSEELSEMMTNISLSEFYCYLSIAEKSYKNWDNAYTNYNKAYAILLNFQYEKPVDFFTKVEKIVGASIKTIEKNLSWAEIYYPYASWLMETGHYAEAAEWYERCNLYEDSYKMMQQAFEKADLHQKYTEWFETKPLFDVYDTACNLFIYRLEAEDAYVDDYIQPCYIVPALRIANTFTYMDLDISCEFDGTEYSWNTYSLKKDEDVVFRLQNMTLDAGVHYCAWYNNDVLIAYETYAVNEGVSELKKKISNNVDATMELCLWNLADETMVTRNLHEGVLNSNDNNLIYVPRLQLENNLAEDIEVEITLMLNGKQKASWSKTKIEANSFYKFICTSPKHIEGINECIWYVNGIEVLRDSYIMANE